MNKHIHKTTGNPVLERLNAFFPRLGTRQGGVSLSSLLFAIGLEVPASAMRQEKEIKGPQIRKK